MARRPKMLIVTTGEDLSLGLFYDPKNTKLVEPVHMSYMSSGEELTSVFQTNFDYVYFRDPFNDKSVVQNDARATTDKVLKKYVSAYMIDGISGYSDTLFEDKWHQYQLFSRYMPRTKLLESRDVSGNGKQLVKKRISS